MPRLKNLPEKIFVGLKSNNELILMPDKTDWGFYAQENIRKVGEYKIVPSVVEKVIAKPVRKKKSAAKPPKETKTKYRCNDDLCGKTFFEPAKDKDENPVCPMCGSLAIEPINEE